MALPIYDYGGNVPYSNWPGTSNPYPQNYQQQGYAQGGQAAIANQWTQYYKAQLYSQLQALAPDAVKKAEPVKAVVEEFAWLRKRVEEFLWKA